MAPQIGLEPIYISIEKICFTLLNYFGNLVILIQKKLNQAGGVSMCVSKVSPLPILRLYKLTCSYSLQFTCTDILIRYIHCPYLIKEYYFGRTGTRTLTPISGPTVFKTAAARLTLPINENYYTLM